MPNVPLPALHLADELLVRPAEAGPLPGRGAADTAALLGIASWAKAFLTRPHEALGRSGHVCPYVSASIREHRFLLTVLHRAAATQRDARRAMLRLCTHFLELEPIEGPGSHRKTIVVLFPDLSKGQTADVINGMHRRLKPHFLRRGLMLGEFFEDSSKPGLHNPDFRPLRSHVPLLVIRSMLLTDIAFLSDQARFTRAFIRVFKARGCEEIRNYIENQRASLPEAQRAMLLEQVARHENGASRLLSASPSATHLGIPAASHPQTP